MIETGAYGGNGWRAIYTLPSRQSMRRWVSADPN